MPASLLLSPSCSVSFALSPSPSRLILPTRCTDPSQRPPTQALVLELDAISAELSVEETRWLDAPDGHPVIDRSKQRRPQANRELAHVGRDDSVKAARSDRDQSVTASYGGGGNDGGRLGGEHRTNGADDASSGAATSSSPRRSPRRAHRLSRMIRGLLAPSASGASHKITADKLTSDKPSADKLAADATSAEKLAPEILPDDDTSTCPIQ